MQNRVDRASAAARNLGFRVERRLVKRFSDVELRQLRSLERAYAGQTGPDLLIFGDSAMIWTAPTDTDRRHLMQMVRDDISAELTFETLAGPGYNPRIIMAFLSALPTCRSRPRVVVVPTSMLMAMSSWLAHPVFGYAKVSEGVRAAVASGRRGRPRRLEREDSAAEEAFDRLPAPSLFGARRTLGELRLITNAAPTTRWQQVIRLRHLMDYYNAEQLTPETEGVRLVGDLARMLGELGLPSVAYIPPVNHEVIGKALGAKAVEHVTANAEVVEAAFLGGGGTAVVNAAFDSLPAEFSDPVHLTDVGRARLAARIADAVRPLL